VDDETTTLLLDATERLLDESAVEVPPLTAVAEALAALAKALVVDKVIVAIDDPHFGRQVFCSGRVPLGESGIGLWGPPRVCTEPPCQLDHVAARLLVAAVGVGLARATASDLEATREFQGRPSRDFLRQAIEAATARAVRHGWGFTFVLVAFDATAKPGDTTIAKCVQYCLRAGDTLVRLDERELGLLLPATPGDQVPHLLARVAKGGGVPSFCYGLASCPGDGGDPAALVALATTRLAEADQARR